MSEDTYDTDSASEAPEGIAVIGMANEANRLADGYRVPVDERFENLF